MVHNLYFNMLNKKRPIKQMKKTTKKINRTSHDKLTLFVHSFRPAAPAKEVSDSPKLDSKSAKERKKEEKEKADREKREKREKEKKEKKEKEEKEKEKKRREKEYKQFNVRMCCCCFFRLIFWMQR